MPVVVDSPMADQATPVYNRWNEEHDEEYASILAHKRHPLRTASMSTASSRDESKKINDMKGARIIISASGMLSGGRVLHHAMPFCPIRTRPLYLLAIRRQGRPVGGSRTAAHVKIMKNWIPVKCHLEQVEGFSAHADWKAVLRWLGGLHTTPKMVFTTHGEPESAAAMAGHIRETFGWNVEVPQYGEKFDLT